MNGSSGVSNSSTTADGAQGHEVAGDSIVLEEEIDPNYVPTQVWMTADAIASCSGARRSSPIVLLGRH